MNPNVEKRIKEIEAQTCTKDERYLLALISEYQCALQEIEPLYADGLDYATETAKKALNFDPDERDPITLGGIPLYVYTCGIDHPPLMLSGGIRMSECPCGKPLRLAT